MIIKLFFNKKLPYIFLFVKLYYIMFNILKSHKYFISTLFISIIAIYITFQHNIGLIIDCGREVYYPQEILNGKVLYKDLFNIYGPFSYLFNAFLYKIFGINLNVICISGAVCAVGIVCGIFLLAKLLLNDNFAFNLSMLTISVGLIPVYIFNYIFPYAFAMTYGLCAFIFSLLFLLYYVNSKSNIYLYVSLLFAGLAITCKYEFLAYLLVYVPVFYRLRPNFNTLIIGLLSFGLAPEMCFAFLFAKGLTFNNLIQTVKIIITMSHTQTLKYFYIHSGVFPHKQSFLAFGVTFLALFVPFLIYLLPVIFKNKIKNPILLLITTYTGICLMILFKNGSAYDIFFSIGILLFFVIILNFKKIINNLSLFIVVASISLISLKVFWGVILNSYGNYYIPLILLAISILFKDKFTEKEWDYIGFYVLILSLLIGFHNLKMIPSQNVPIKTLKGNLYVEKKYKTTNQLLNFIEKNTKKTDKIIIYPEGMMINFLSDRKSDSFYNSMIPLYEETFGVDTYIKHFEKNMPKYIIFNSWNSSDYYFSIICEDYGFKFCEFVKNKYFEKSRLQGDFSYIIFERK